MIRIVAFVAVALLGACGGSTLASSPASDSGAPTVADAEAAGDAAPRASQDASTPSGSSDITVVIRSVYLGDTNRDGVASPTAWQQYGRDIDGVTTTATSVNLCTLYPGAPTSVQVDGDGGIDNSYGANILPILMTLMGSTYSSTVNAAIEEGTLGTIPFDLGALADSGSVGGLFAWEVMAAPLATPPLWDGTDLWPIDALSQTGPNPDVRYPLAVLDNWVWTSGDTDAPVAYVPFLFPYTFLPVHEPEVVMRVANDLSGATNGTFSATVRTVDVLSALEVAAGQISPSLCASSAFGALSEQIEQASDIPWAGGDQGQCDGISIGFGFDATAARLGSVVTPNTQAPACPL